MTRPRSCGSGPAESRDGDAAAEALPGWIRLGAAARVRGAGTEPLRGGRAGRRRRVHRDLAGRWSYGFLVWMATLDEPMEVLDPPELIEAARAVAARLGAAA